MKGFKDFQKHRDSMMRFQIADAQWCNHDTDYRTRAIQFSLSYPNENIFGVHVFSAQPDSFGHFYFRETLYLDEAHVFCTEEGFNLSLQEFNDSEDWISYKSEVNKYFFDLIRDRFPSFNLKRS